MTEDKRLAVTIRPGRPTDAVVLMKVLRRNLAECAFEYPEFDEVAGLQNIIGVISHGLCLVAECGGRIVGTIAQEPGQFWWNRKFWFTTNSWFYVHETFRDGRTPDALIDAMVKLCDEKKAPMMMAILNGLRADAKDRFVRKHGFTYAGGVFVRGFDQPPQTPLGEGGE